MKISATAPQFQNIEQQLFPVFYFEDKESSSFTALKMSNPTLVDSLIDASLIISKSGSVMPLIGHTDLPASQVVIIGCGKSKDLDESALIKTLQTIVTEARKMSAASVALTIDDVTPSSRTSTWAVEKATEVLLTSLYEYDTTKSTKAEARTLAEVLLFSEEQSLEKAINTGQAVAKGVNVARELGNLPANICDPTYLAEYAQSLADSNELLEVEILEESDMEAMGMGAFLAVSQGSDKPAKLIVMKYNGGPKDQKPHVIVGKGLTFDAGGISIKPAGGMEEMKWDMLGAASVIGTMTTMCDLKPALNIIGVVASAENMINGSATRPGDVVTCMNGKTVEIINTDAEGRLVLCDTLTYVEKFEPESVIDIATLTGAAVIALGHHATAVYSNNDELQKSILNAGDRSWDRGWPMPLWDEYKEDLKSPYADLRNVGSRAGGSITAAVYLANFTQNYTWAHLDIAGTGWMSAKTGATGRPVGMLSNYLLDQLA